jgi:single-strand DNA-binding protein
MFEQYIIIGRVGRDAEARFTPSGKQVTAFSVAVSEKYTNSAGEKVESTKWIRVSVWGRTAEICQQYVKKGMLIQCVGKLKGDDHGNPRVYETNGTSKASFEMTATSVQFLSKNENSNAPAEVTEDEAMPF